MGSGTMATSLVDRIWTADEVREVIQALKDTDGTVDLTFDNLSWKLPMLGESVVVNGSVRLRMRLETPSASKGRRS